MAKSTKKLGRPPTWTKKKTIKAIKTWAEKHGEAPTSKQWERSGGSAHPSATAVRRVFDTWNDAIKAAGFEPLPRGHLPGDGVVWGEQDIIDAIQRWVRVHGAPPTVSNWRNRGEWWPGHTTVIQRFDTWNDAMIAAGCKPRNRGNQPLVAA